MCSAPDLAGFRGGNLPVHIEMNKMIMTWRYFKEKMILKNFARLADAG